MPTTYPAANPTLSGDLLTISRFLNNPTAITRRLRTFADLRFVSDQILTQRFRSSGGAVLYEMSESQLTDKLVTAVGAGSEYPYANLPTGTAALAAIVKWGQKVLLTDEEIGRTSEPGSAVDRAFSKVIASVVKQVDTVSMSAVASAITATAGTAGIWDHATVASRKPLDDILLAIQAIEDLNLGYTPDTLLVSPKAYTYLMLNEAIQNARQREVSDNPVYTGMIESVAGLKIIKSPNLVLSTTATVLDSKALGGMADEIDGAPGYSIADVGVQIQAIRKPGQDAWDLQGRRKTVPVVQEPGAGYEISGVVS
jgi:hypothetical protein